MPGGARTQLKPQAVVLVAAGQQFVSVAAQLGVHERTVRRWAANDAFAAQVREVQAEAVRRACGRLAVGMAAAAEVLVGLLDDPDPRVRLGAARELIVAAARVRDQHDLEGRLAALEAQARALTDEEGGPHAGRD
jgi:hypothetical protein